MWELHGVGLGLSGGDDFDFHDVIPWGGSRQGINVTFSYDTGYPKWGTCVVHYHDELAHGLVLRTIWTL